MERAHTCLRVHVLVSGSVVLSPGELPGDETRELLDAKCGVLVSGSALAPDCLHRNEPFAGASLVKASEVLVPAPSPIVAALSLLPSCL